MTQIILWVLVGFLVGFFCAIGIFIETEKKSIKRGVVTLDGKIYRLTEVKG